MAKDLISILQSSNLFTGLSAEQIRGLITGKRVRMVSFHKNDILFWTDHDLDYLYVIVHGKVAIAQNTMSGKRIFNKSVQAEGELCGDVRLFSDKKLLWDYAVAMDETEALEIDSAILLESDSVDPKIQAILLRNIVTNVVDRVDRIGQKVRVLSVPSVRERIVYYLLLQPVSDNRIRLDSTQENIADFLGVARPLLSRELGRMQNDGLIRMDGRKVEILDR